MELLLHLASALGGAVAAALATYRMTTKSLQKSDISPAATASPAAAATTPYVKLTAEDSSRLATVTALLERLVSLEEQTQAYVHQLTDQIIALRVEGAKR